MEDTEKELREQLNKVIDEKRQLECIMSTILECGSMDLSMLYNIEYDFSDILDYLQDIGATIGLNELLEGAIDIFRRNILIAIDDKISEIEGDFLGREQEYDDLKSLDIYEDTSYYVNYLDSSIYWDCSDEIQSIYKKYLSEVIDRENNMLGFTSLDI